MKFTIIAIIIIATFTLKARLSNRNPYYDINKKHHTKTGFMNPYLKSENQGKSFSDLIKMILTKRPKPKYQPTEKLNVYELNKRISQNQNVITWIGHSTMLISIDGKVILTDPIFSKRCYVFMK